MEVERRAAFMLVVTTAIWGSTFPTMKIARAEIGRLVPDTWAESAFFFLGARFLLGALLFAAIFPRAVRKLTRRVLLESLWVALPGIAGIALQMVSLGTGSSAMVAFITSLTVVTVPVTGWLLYHERLPRSLAAGAFVALVGGAILTNPFGGGFGRDEVLTFVATVLFGYQIHLINRITRRHDPAAVTLGVFAHFAWVCAALLAVTDAGRSMMGPSFLRDVFSPGSDGPWWMRHAMAWILPYHALAATVVAFGITLRFQRDVPATRAAVIYCMEPVWAVFLAALLREAVTFPQVLGGAVIILGNLMCELWRPRPMAPGAPGEPALPPGKGPPPPGP